MINKEKYINSHEDEINDDFVTACGEGNLELVKYLLTSSELKYNANIHNANYFGEQDNGLFSACCNGHLEIVKYLLTSKELKEHANITDNDHCFNTLCVKQHLDVIQFLIFDFNIKKTKQIQECLDKNKDKNNKIENMFKIRDLRDVFNKELNSDKINNNKVKI